LRIKILYTIKLIFLCWLCVFACGCAAVTPDPSPMPIKTPAATVEPLLSPTSATIPPQYNEYTVKLDIHPSDNTVTGTEKIKIVNTSGRVLDKVYINVPLNAFSENASVRPVLDEHIDTVFPDGINYGYMEINSVYVCGEEVEFKLDETVLSVNLPAALPPDEWTELRIELDAKIPVMNHRTGSGENGMWFGSFLPILAVCDENGWHTDPYYPIGDPFYARAANFNVSITTPPEFTVVGPGVPLITDQDDKKITEFSTKLSRDFAFAISNSYTKSSITTPSNVEISLYTFSDTARKPELLELASRSLEYFSNRIGAYPYSTLVIAETRLFSKGGIEYSGVIFIDSDYLLASESFSSITHEIGHQWFYNIIGNNQIDFAWMGEGLCSFLQEGFLLNDVELDNKMAEEYAYLQSIIPETIPNTLNSSLGDFESWQDYYNIHYLRGKMMFYSLYKHMGKESFDSFLIEYNRRFSFRIASPKDLAQTAEDVSGMELGTFFEAWINEPELPHL